MRGALRSFSPWRANLQVYAGMVQDGRLATTWADRLGVLADRLAGFNAQAEGARHGHRLARLRHGGIEQHGIEAQLHGLHRVAWRTDAGVDDQRHTGQAGAQAPWPLQWAALISTALPTTTPSAPSGQARVQPPPLGFSAFAPWLRGVVEDPATLGLLLAAVLQPNLMPRPFAPTLQDIDEAMRKSIAENPLPSAAAKAYETILPSLVRVVGQTNEAQKVESEIVLFAGQRLLPEHAFGNPQHT